MEMQELSYEELEQVVGGFVIAGDCDPDAVTELYLKSRPPVDARLVF